MFATEGSSGTKQGIDIFVNGVRYPSFKEYKETQRAAEEKAAQEKVAKGSAGKKLLDDEAVPLAVDADLPGGKTVSFNPDGSMKVEKGVDMAGERMVGVVSAGKSASTKELPIAVQKEKGTLSGRVAGVKPSVREVVRDFDAGTKGAQTREVRVSSLDEIRQDLARREDLTGRPVLFLSDKNKVRIMELTPEEGAPSVTGSARVSVVREALDHAEDLPCPSSP